MAEGLWVGTMALLTLERAFYLDRVGAPPNALLLAWTVNLTWAALLPIVVTVSLRQPLGRGRRAMAAHLLTFAAVITIEAAVYVWVERTFLPLIPWAPSFGLDFAGRVRNTMAGHFVTSCLGYGVIAAATHAYAYHQLFRDRQVRAARLEAQLAQSQLQVLRSQLHPHFLFNALHAVSTLMHRDVDAADTTLARLSDLLRMSLTSLGANEVPLKEELEFLERYVEIELTRFRDRLGVRIDVSPEVLDACVPQLLLQPLVENAIRHGIAPRPGPGSVQVRAWRSGDDLRLLVRDDGLGASSAPENGQARGVGLTNARDRLRRLYGRRQRFRAFAPPSGGFLVSVRLPFHTTPVPGGGAEA